MPFGLISLSAAMLFALFAAFAFLTGEVFIATDLLQWAVILIILVEIGRLKK